MDGTKTGVSIGQNEIVEFYEGQERRLRDVREGFEKNALEFYGVAPERQTVCDGR